LQKYRTLLQRYRVLLAEITKEREGRQHIQVWVECVAEIYGSVLPALALLSDFRQKSPVSLQKSPIFLQEIPPKYDCVWVECVAEI